MSLQVWLPLRGNVLNFGDNCNVTVTNSGATVNETGGKIGYCYQFTVNQYMQINGIDYTKLGHCSICFWIKIPVDDGNWLPFTGNSTSYYIMATSGGTGGFYHAAIGSGAQTIYCDGVPRTTPINDGNWHHYCITDINLTGWNKILINNYGGTGSTWNFNGCMNDIRIYDYILSPKEVKEISKALVMHYTLDDEWLETTTNLSTQGTCSGWANSGAATRSNDDTTVPCPPYTDWKTLSITETTDGQCAITFGTTRINLPSKTLSASTWFYLSGDPTSSISPYIRSSQSDGNVCTLAYNGNTSITTWPREKWIRITGTFTSNISATTFYFCAYTAKAGCKFAFNGWQIEEKDHVTPYTKEFRGPKYDKSSYTEPDGSTWVRIAHHNNPASYLFSSGSNWSQGVYVDDNRWFDIYGVVGGLSRFEFMVKQKATSGSSEVKYRWVQTTSPLTATYDNVKPASVTRITTSGYTDGGYGGLYILNSNTHMVIANTSNGNWYGAFGCWTAYQSGIPGYPNTTVTSGYMDLYVRVDNPDLLPKNYIDSAGYQKQSEIIRIDSVITGSPRYLKCIKNTTQYPIKTVVKIPESKGLTIACWMNLSEWGAQTSGIWATSNESNHPSDYNTTACNHRDNGFDIRGTNGTTYRLGCDSSHIPIGVWTHVAFVHNGSTAYLYINGQVKTSVSVPTSLVSFNNFYLGYSYAGGLTRQCKGCWSDLRIYVTALSDVDIKELYDTAAYIHNTGNLSCYEANETSHNLLRYENTLMYTNTNNTSVTRGKYVTRNGVLAMAFQATDTYYGSNDERNSKLLYGFFKPNTQYVFDLWIDVDDIIYQNVNRTGAFTIVYTDGTTSGEFNLTGSTNPATGWQHKVVITPAGKSVRSLAIYYYVSSIFYVRADSHIVELSETDIAKNGVVSSGQFIENTDTAFIGKATFNENHLLEI